MGEGDDYMDSEEMLFAEISHFTAIGVKYYEDFCRPCIGGFSDPGSDECEPCPANTYYDDEWDVDDGPFEACYPCPEDTFSYPGSIGYDSCLPLPECEGDAYEVSFEETCKNGERKVVYELWEPAACYVEDDEEKVFEETEDCEECPLGYFEKTLSGGYTKCERCPTGQITSADMKSC